MIALRAQSTIVSYLTTWGICVVRGGCPDGLSRADLFDEPTPLQRAGIFRATFAPQVLVPEGEEEEREGTGTCPGRLRSAIDVPRKTIYWPADAADPYFLLHEGAHLVEALLTGVPPTVHDENGLLAAFEYLSAWYLERLGSHIVSRDGWQDWRCYTGDDTDSSLDRAVKAYSRSLVDAMLFTRDRAPTFWLPDGSLRPPTWDPWELYDGAEARATLRRRRGRVHGDHS